MEATWWRHGRTISLPDAAPSAGSVNTIEQKKRRGRICRRSISPIPFQPTAEETPLKTYQHHLEPDPEIPRLQVLAVDVVEVPIADVLQRGIHPVWTFEDPTTLQEAFVQGLYAVDIEIPHLEQLDFCGNVDALTQARYYQGKCPFQQLVEHLKHGLRFVSH